MVRSLQDACAVLDELADEYVGKAKICKLNVDDP
jgi:hypothetical protein